MFLKRPMAYSVGRTGPCFHYRPSLRCLKLDRGSLAVRHPRRRRVTIHPSNLALEGATMPTIRKEIDIEAPVDRVFEICENPEAIADLVPQVTEVNMDHRTEERIGDQFKVTYGSFGGA